MSVSSFNIPESISQRLQAVRRRSDRIQAATLAMTALTALLITMIAAMTVDWTFTLFDHRWRSGLTVAALGVSGCTLVAGAILLLLKRKTVASTANDVDHAVPILQERWSTLTELADVPQVHQRNMHQGMLTRLMQEAASLEDHVVPENVVSRRQLFAATSLFSVLTAVLLLACAVDSQQVMVLIRRFWFPGQDITLTTIDANQSPEVAVLHERYVVRASLGGRPVDSAQLHIRRSNEPETEELTLLPSGNSKTELTHRIRSVDADFEYRIRAGDHQTDWHRVFAAERPLIAATRFEVEGPDYAFIPNVEIEDLPSEFRVLEGSTVRISIKPNNAIRHAEVQFDSASDQRAAAMMPLESGWYQLEFTAVNSAKLSIVVTEPHGLQNLHPPMCRLRVRPDQRPKVKVTSPTNDSAVRPEEEIEIEFTANDDLGISRAELVVYGDHVDVDGNPIELKRTEIPLATDTAEDSDETERQKPPTEVKGSIPLNLSEFDLLDGDRISYEVRVYDTREAHQGQMTGGFAAAEQNADTTVDGRPVSDEQDNSPQMNTDGSVDADNGAEQKLPSSVPDATTDTTTDSSAAASPDETGVFDTSRPPAPVDTPGSSGTDIESAMANEASGRSLLSDSGISSTTVTGTMSTSQEGQTASSNRMQIVIDSFAGSFSSQQRSTLERAIEPVLGMLAEELKRAANHSKSLLEHLEARKSWKPPQTTRLGQVSTSLREASAIVQELSEQTADTPYAFVGLRIHAIRHGHIEPAAEEIWAALQADSDTSRTTRIENAWQHTLRAIEQLETLNTRFDRVVHEHKLADALARIEKMYEVFVENSMAMLNQPQQSQNGMQRKMVETEYSDEYLERLAEIYQMRQELLEELARILQADPRLLRRYMAGQLNRAESLRDQLTRLAQRQTQLSQELQVLSGSSDATREEIINLATRGRLGRSSDLANATADLHETYIAWQPLDESGDQPALAEGSEQLLRLTVATRQLEAMARRWEGMAPPSAKKSDAPDDEGALNAEEQVNSTWLTLPQIAEQAERAMQIGEKLDQVLRQIAPTEDQVELTEFAVNRIRDTEELLRDLAQWKNTIDLLAEGDSVSALSEDQYELAAETELLSRQLNGFHERVGLSQYEEVDADAVERIGRKSNELISMLQNEVAGNQLRAVFALRTPDVIAAAQFESETVDAFTSVEGLIDDIFQSIARELDKLPPRDPIAELLDDPTLDELLAGLEREGFSGAGLGLPGRPSNLMFRFNRGRLAQQWLRQQTQLDRRRLHASYQRALSRALGEKEEAIGHAQAMIRRRTRRLAEWNTLASKLQSELLQSDGQEPPPEYRRAIEHYFNSISKDLPATP